MDQQTHMVHMVKLMKKNVPWFAPMILIISVEMIGEIVSMILLLIQGLSYYREAVALDPDLVEGHYNLGTALLRSGRAAEALPHLRQVVVLQPGLAEARNNLGIALQLVGQSAAAVAEFRRALALRPDYAEARTNLDAALARGDVSR